jgi:hypothetical protein
MNEIHGLKMFGKDPDYLSRLGRDQGYYPQDGGDSNRRESKNNDDKFIGSLVRRTEDQNEGVPYDGPWYIGNRGLDDISNGRSLGSSIAGDNGMRTMMKRYGHFGPFQDRAESYLDQRHRRGQLYLNHLARMNK